MKNNSFTEIWEKLLQAKRIVMSLHFGPDGDSLGSCVAMSYALKREGKETHIYSRDNLSPELMDHLLSKEVEFGKQLSDWNYKKGDVLLLLDSGSKKQFFPEEYDASKIDLVVIDHHATNSGFGRLSYVDSSKISCCSVLLALFRELDIFIDTPLATRLALGIYTDSGGLSFQSEAVIELAYLIERGVNYVDDIVNPIKFNMSLRIKQYFSKAIANFKEADISPLRIGYSTVSFNEIEELQLNHSEVRGAIGYLQELGGYDVIFMLTEQEDSIKGSFRSRTGIDVSVYAKALGGGGHKAAAAFVMPKMPLIQAEQEVLSTIKKMGVTRV